jgi:hypothetical protein
MIQFYTYIYFDPRTDKPFYVGKGKDDRAYGKHSNKQFNGRLNKLNDVGLKPIVEIMNTTNELSSFWLERCLIAAYGRKDQGTGPLFNHTDGGQGSSGIIQSAETRKLHSIAMSKLGENHPMRRSEVVKELSVRFKGRLMWDCRGENCTMKRPEVAAKISGDNHHTRKPGAREKLQNQYNSVQNVSCSICDKVGKPWSIKRHFLCKHPGVEYERK